MTAEETERLEHARSFAARMHEGQVRKGGAPYITHPEAVAGIVRDWGYGGDYQICALFHDLLEDTPATPAEIEELGGTSVREAVELLTKEPGYDMSSYVQAICGNPMAFAVKAADRLHNLRSAHLADEAFRRRYIRETEDWYMDFAPEIPEAVRELEATLGAPGPEDPAGSRAAGGKSGGETDHTT